VHEKEVLAGSVLEIESAGFEERRPFRPLTTLIDLRDCVRVAFEACHCVRTVCQTACWRRWRRDACIWYDVSEKGPLLDAEQSLLGVTRGYVRAPPLSLDPPLTGPSCRSRHRVWLRP
jgi:hypothetical protein